MKFLILSLVLISQAFAATCTMDLNVYEDEIYVDKDQNLATAETPNAVKMKGLRLAGKHSNGQAFDFFDDDGFLTLMMIEKNLLSNVRGSGSATTIPVSAADKSMLKKSLKLLKDYHNVTIAGDFAAESKAYSRLELADAAKIEALISKDQTSYPASEWLSVVGPFLDRGMGNSGGGRSYRDMKYGNSQFNSEGAGNLSRPLCGEGTVRCPCASNISFLRKEFLCQGSNAELPPAPEISGNSCPSYKYSVNYGQSAGGGSSSQSGQKVRGE